MNKKRILILCTISTCIILIVLAFIALKYSKVSFLEKGILTDTNQYVIDEMTFFVYDNTEEKLKTLVRISRENGIDTVEYANENNESVILDCHGKQRVSIDISIELNKEYSFLVTSSGNTTTEKLLIDEAYMKDYLDGIMLVTDISSEEDNIVKLELQFQNELDQKTNYYRIGNTGNWIQCANAEINEITIDDNQVDLNDLQDGNLARFYTKQVDVAGNTLIKEQLVEVKTVKLDVFNDMRVSGTSLQQYGFTASWVNGEDKAFTIGNFVAGHHTNNASWSGTFNWSNPKTYGATVLYVDIYQHARGSSYAGSRVTITYSDGTTDTKTNANSGGDKHYPTTINLKKGVSITNIQFYLSGKDENYTESSASITSIVLKRN